MDITDRHVILVEDIIDSGYTIRFLKDRLQGAGPKSGVIASTRGTAQSPGSQDRIFLNLLSYTVADALFRHKSRLF